MPSTPLLYTPEQAAEQLACSRTTIYELMSSGELESIKVRSARRIPADALATYVQRLREEQRQPAGV